MVEKNRNQGNLMDSIALNLRCRKNWKKHPDKFFANVLVKQTFSLIGFVKFPVQQALTSQKYPARKRETNHLWRRCEGH